MRRRQDNAGSIRVALAERLRDVIARRPGGALEEPAGPWLGCTAERNALLAVSMLARIEADEPVVLPRWKLRGLMPVAPPAGGWVCLEPDGSVVPVEFVRDKHDPMSIVDYRRPDNTLVLGGVGVDA